MCYISYNRLEQSALFWGLDKVLFPYLYHSQSLYTDRTPCRDCHFFEPGLQCRSHHFEIHFWSDFMTIWNSPKMNLELVSFHFFALNSKYFTSFWFSWNLLHVLYVYYIITYNCFSTFFQNANYFSPLILGA